MVSAISNLNVATPPPAFPASSGASGATAVDSPSAPDFGQTMHDFLNRTTPAAQPPKTSISSQPSTGTTVAPASSDSPATSFSASAAFGGRAKPSNKSQDPGKAAVSSTAPARALLSTSLLTMLLPTVPVVTGSKAVVLQNPGGTAADASSNSAIDAGGALSANPAGAQPAPAASSAVAESSPDANSLPPGTFLTPDLPIAFSLAPPESDTSEPTGELASWLGRATTAQVDAATPTANAIARALQEGNDKSLVDAPAANQKTPIAIVDAGPTASLLSKGQSVSALFEQLQELLGPESAGRVTGSAGVDLRHTEVQSQLSQGAPQILQSSVTNAHALAADAAGATIATKAAESLGPGTRAAILGQGTSPAPGSPSAPGDATPEQNHQGTPDSSLSTDTASAPATPPKASSEFADLLAGNGSTPPDTLQPQGSIATSPIIVPAASASDASEHPAPSILPSAPAQAQPPAPVLPNVPEAAPARMVSDAQLNNAASQSEMRIAMQTDKLGAIELHARVSGDEVGAAIIVEKRDAHAALAVELPALQQALSEKQLRVDQVALTQGALHSTAGDAGGSTPQGQRSMHQPQRSTVNSTEDAVQPPTAAAWFVPEATGVFDSQGRLSVQV